jgi:hypothetical protein
MNYLLLIHHGSAPTPEDPQAWASLSEEEQKAVFADYQAISQTPGVTPGQRMQAPEMATTVRVHDGKTMTTDGPYVEMKEALGGYLFFEADDLDAAIALAARVPAARLGGAVEIRPLG